MTVGARGAAFFHPTLPAPCPYLPGRAERKAVVEIAGDNPAGLHDALVRAGFRRSHGMAYRPACPGCGACLPVRIVAGGFRRGGRFRRAARALEGLACEERPAAATDEQFALFHRYQKARHGGDMEAMGFPEYRDMVERTPVETRVVEMRGGDGRLAAVSITDRVSDGLSGVYKFWEPERRGDSLGSAVLLWHVGRARELGLPFVYLGYWIEGSPKMAWKRRFRPLEALTPRGWEPFPGPGGGGTAPGFPVCSRGQADGPASTPPRET